MSLLRKEEQEADGIEVTWEDQQHINTFSKYNARLGDLQDELKTRQQDKEYYDDLEMELELADEDDQVLYKQGDAFFHLKSKAALKTLKTDRKAIERDIQSLKRRVEECETGMKDLKVQLKAKFGNQINLDLNPEED
ncbi:hypothetical protein NliqN6_0718 [Naganishia liquefaciens]|uniref:Prefoldin subunit 4 n=1 Tax=Naganishia liquefaciens TaxID=104408 RepID=A0A8H3TNC5_9TREE|nr:hypothetical protein NliqN6_0718 [Naganishia liquefaciens]